MIDKLVGLSEAVRLVEDNAIIGLGGMTIYGLGLGLGLGLWVRVRVSA